MNISFCANLRTNPEQFYLSSDTKADKTIIQHEFENLKKYLDIPAVKKTTANDTIDIIRHKTKKKFSYKIIYHPDGFNPIDINYNVNSITHGGFSGSEIFKQITCILAFIKHKFPSKLFANVDFLDIAKLVYLPKK